MIALYKRCVSISLGIYGEIALIINKDLMIFTGVEDAEARALAQGISSCV